MSKSRIPSPARSHGAITPRRVRPLKKTRSVASPSLRNTPRLTNIMKDAFQLSPLPQRRSVLNDDTDIQEPLRKSWWKNLNENSRNMQELYENMNPPVANNILDDIDIEQSSPEKEFSIEIPDSSDGESFKSIATPQRKKIFSNKESTKQNYFKNMTIVQHKRKFSSQQGSDSDESINIVPKKIFNYTKDKSISSLPQELLKNLKKDHVNTSASMEVPRKKGHNLFGKEPETAPKISDMGLNVIQSDLDVEMHDLPAKPVFSFKRRSSVKHAIRSSIQSIVEEDWSNPLPSSTMIGSISDEERTPKQKILTEQSILQLSPNKSIEKENSMDDTLVDDQNDSNDNIENQVCNKTQSPLMNTLADHNETLVNHSISKHNQSHMKDPSVNQNQTLTHNKSIGRKTKNSLNDSESNQMHIEKEKQRENISISASTNIAAEKDVSEKENSNMKLKDNIRVSEGPSNSSINNSGWDSHRTTRKTLRQTFGKDFTPRKSLRTLVMEKTAKRHTVGNFRSQGISKEINISKIYQTNNTTPHNKTAPGRHPDCNKIVHETDENQSDDGEHNFVESNNDEEIEKPTEEQESNENGKRNLTDANTECETDIQISNKDEENYRELSNNDDQNLSDQADEDVNQMEEEVGNAYDEENNEIENQTEVDEQKEIEMSDGEEEGGEEESLRESISDMPNQSDDPEQPTEAENAYEEENISEAEEQEESKESTNKTLQSSYENQMAETSNHDNAEQTDNDREEIIEPENQSEDEEQEEMIQSDSELHQSSSQEQIESSEESENQSDNVEEASNNEVAETNENQDSYAEETHDHLIDNEDISQMPQANSTEYPVIESTQAKEIPNKTINKQKMQELIEKIRVENAERKRKLDTEVSDWRKNIKPQLTNTFFKVPQKPAIKRPQTKENKAKKIKPADKMFLNVLPPEFFEDIKYKPPKRYQPRNAAWANKHLYTFLEQKLEPKYDYKARVRAEKLVEIIYKFTQDIRRFEVAPEPAVSALKHEMARLKVIDTHFDFYEFIIDFLPQDIRHKVVPSSVNLIPLPRPSVYSSIIIQNNNV